MTLTPVQAAHRAARRARLEIDATRAANALDDAPRLLAWRDECRTFLRSNHQAMTTLEDEAHDLVTQIAHIQRRLCELGYTGD